MFFTKFLYYKIFLKTEKNLFSKFAKRADVRLGFLPAGQFVSAFELQSSQSVLESTIGIAFKSKL